MGKGNSKEGFAPEEYARGKSKSLHSISGPKNFVKHIHVGLDEEGKYEGMPDIWVDLLELSPEMVAYKISTDDLDENVKPIEPDETIINTIRSMSTCKFKVFSKIKEAEEEKESEYNIELDENSEVMLKGLPENWK